ncbi:uncharacterized protein LOC129590559 isoform X2 [Paramacrobiotus metropolitanus]|uniref:uncharacterized protein LOC129590559 isoform X2 n=1 Tax=Paramacrobiotus metropolitanus TaxID=2943436 RepID=UPI0024460A9C|nr:uncharacterized protein LOC129590559 isoform X2 [Paramacrobiotus metropolitanus]
MIALYARSWSVCLDNPENVDLEPVWWSVRSVTRMWVAGVAVVWNVWILLLHWCTACSVGRGSPPALTANITFQSNVPVAVQHGTVNIGGVQFNIALVSPQTLAARPRTQLDDVVDWALRYPENDKITLKFPVENDVTRYSAEDGEIFARPRLGEPATFTCVASAEGSAIYANTISWLHQGHVVFDKGQPVKANGVPLQSRFANLNDSGIAKIFDIRNVSTQTSGDVVCHEESPGRPHKHRTLRRYRLLPYVTRVSEVFSEVMQPQWVWEGDFAYFNCKVRLPLPAHVLATLGTRIIMWRLKGRMFRLTRP